MAIFNFKKNVKIYIVQDGIQYRAEVSDINFSQTFTENSYEVKTLHNQGNLFEASTINKANPANFDFSLNLLKENDLQYIVNLAIDYETNTKTIQTFDLYIDTKASLFKIEGCAITNTSFNIERNSLLSLDISGQGSKLTQIDRWDVNSWNDPPDFIGVGWTDLGSGRYNCDGTQTFNTGMDTYSVAVHNIDYLVSLEIESISAGNIYAILAGITPPDLETFNTVGVFAQTLNSPSGTNALKIKASEDFIGIVKNISFQKLNVPGTVVPLTTSTYIPIRYLNIILNRLELQVQENINLASYWAPFGSNIIEQEGDEVKIAYVSNIQGGKLTFSNTLATITKPLELGIQYTITGLARVLNNSDTADITTNAAVTELVTIQSSTLAPFSITFTCDDITFQHLHLNKLWADEIMWISDVRIYETVTGDTISDSVFNVSIELQNNIEWTPYTTINEALDTTDATNSMYPSQFVLKNRILAGSIGIYLRDDNVNYLQNWDSDIPLRIQAGEDSGGIIYGLDFNMPACTLTNRLGVDSVFTQSYDWRMTHNPSDLSDVITYVTL